MRTRRIQLKYFPDVKMAFQIIKIKFLHYILTDYVSGTREGNWGFHDKEI